MTDRYAALRAALEAYDDDPTDSSARDRFYGNVDSDIVRALLAENDRRGEALLWTAGALQMACVVDVIMGEADGISINNETRTVVQILDAADAALAQEGS